MRDPSFVSGAVGFLFLPNTAGKSLEEIEAERGVLDQDSVRTAT